MSDAIIVLSWEKLEDWECCCGNPEHTRPGQWKWVARTEGYSASADTPDRACARVQYMLDCKARELWPSPRKLAASGVPVIGTEEQART